MTQPVVPVSWGELWDKITILEIKVQRLRAAPARANTARELTLLRAVAGPLPLDIVPMRWALLAVNTRLWWIEDRIRELDAGGDFGPAFIAFARAVYRENDERARIKAEINRRLHSDVVEEKQYPAYPAAP